MFRSCELDCWWSPVRACFSFLPCVVYPLANLPQDAPTVATAKEISATKKASAVALATAKKVLFVFVVSLLLFVLLCIHKQS